MYYLLTEKDGYYDYLRSGEKGNIFLEEGEIWKIGETIQWNPITRQQYRYSEAWLQDNNLFFFVVAQGTQGKMKKEEQVHLFNYFSIG